MAQPLIDNFAIVSKETIDLSDEEKKLMDQTNRDCSNMDDYARPAREMGREAIRGYMALSTGAQLDGRSKLFVPKIHAITYARMAMEAAQMPTVEFKHRKSKSALKMKFLNAAKDNAEDGDGNLRPDSLNLWFHQNFDKILFGTGFRYLSYLLQRRIVQVRDDRGKIVEKTEMVYDDIWDEVPDFFHVGVSRDMQPGMFGGASCYMDKFFTKDGFMERFDTKYYKNLDIAVSRDSWLPGEEDYDWEVPSGYVRVRFYWNLYKDLFFVQGNGVPIRNDFIQDYGDYRRPRKFLPITSIHNDFAFDMKEPSFSNVYQGGRLYVNPDQSSTNKTFWTKSDVMLTRGLIGFSNAIARAAVDHTKASSVHFLLAQSAGVYDQVRSADLYGIVPLKTADGSSFDVKSLTEGSGYLQNFVAMDEWADNLMTYSLGNDWKRAATELTNEKATVAAIKQQVQRIRMSQNLKFNESGGIKRHYRILLNLIQQYYPIETIRDLGADDLPKDFPEEKIVRDPDGKIIGAMLPKDVPFAEEIGFIYKNGKPKAVPKIEKYLKEDIEFGRSFPAYESLIRTDEEPEVYVEPGSSFAELKAIERAVLDEKMQRIFQFLGISYPTGEVDQNGMPVVTPLVPREGVEYLMEQYLKAFDDDPDKVFNREDEEKKKEKEKDNLPAPFSGGQPFTPPEIPMMQTGGGQTSPAAEARQTLAGMVRP